MKDKCDTIAIDKTNISSEIYETVPDILKNQCDLMNSMRKLERQRNLDSVNLKRKMWVRGNKR